MIVLSLMERDPAAARLLAAAPPLGTDMVEVRLDALRRRDPEAWFPSRAGAGKPLIVACRRASDGGHYRGSESARRELLLAAARAGAAWIDVEHRSAYRGIVDRAGPSRVLLSHHDRRRTPPAAERLALYRRMAAVPGVAAVKIVTTARDVSDILEIRKLLQRASGGKVPLAAFAMGEPGVPSRILAPSWGSWATYVALDRGREAAPGQITLSEAVDLYRIPEIDEETRLTGLIGWPIAHSLSPVLHNAAFHREGLNFRYLPFPAPRVSSLRALMRDLPLRGLSVTAPHKIAALKAATRAEPLAMEIGAANTLLWDGRRAVGFNTDVEGFLKPLCAKIDPSGRTAAVAGAGGAARAAAFALARAGATVLVASRREGPGRDLASRVGGRWVAPRRLHRESYDILVNATPAGMDGRSMAFGAAAVRGSLVVDLVYRPALTPLILAAREKGIPAIGGLEILLAQGIAQYALFTGRTAPEGAMREALDRALASSGAGTL